MSKELYSIINWTFGINSIIFSWLEYLRSEFKFWNVHGIMNTSGLLQSKRMLTLQETRSIHDSMNIPKIEFIAYIYILI